MGDGTPDTGHCRLTGKFITAVVKTVPAPPSSLGGTEKKVKNNFNLQI